MAILEMNQLLSRLDGTAAETVLVRGASAPSRPPETVTIAPGITATAGFERTSAPLFVTAEASSGRTVRRYDGPGTDAAAECAVELTADREPRAVWLCERAQIVAWWSERIARSLERRLGTAAREVNARLVVWANENAEAVGDRYDVVLDP